MFKASKAVRFFFLNTAIISTVAIWLSGFNNAHGVMYAFPRRSVGTRCAKKLNHLL